MNTVNCENPQVILHPSYLEFMHRYSHIGYSHFDSNGNCTKSFLRYIDSYHISQIENGVSFYKLFNFPFPSNVSDFDDYFFCDLVSGERQDVYIRVPCGKCSCCQNKTFSSLMQRMQFGLEYDSNSPLFVTLTYNDSHLPTAGVSIRDIQNFKKRLNKLVSQLFPDVHLKYCFFSEYGKLGRPHYHGVIYAFPLEQLKAIHGLHYFIEAVRMIQFCWRKTPKTAKKCDRLSYSQYCKKGYKVFESDGSDKFSFGFVNVVQTNNSSRTCFSYISKYIGKGSNVPEGKNKNFHSFSVNLGVDFVRSLKDFVFNDKRKVRYLSRQDGTLKECSLCSYYIKKLFPSLSLLLPPEFRKKWFELHYLSDFFSTNFSLPEWFRGSVSSLTLDIESKFPVLVSMYPCKDVFRSDSFKKQQYRYATLFYEDFNETLDSKVFLGFEDKNPVYGVLSRKFKDDFSDYLDLYNFFKVFNSRFPDFNSSIMLSLHQRELFLKGLNFSSDPVITSVRFRRNKSKLFSQTKLL